MPLPWLETDPIQFPPVEQALRDPDGLLAAGGSLSPEWLLHAYRQGIFPWYEEGQPLLWWSPDPRLVLFPERIRISRSLRKFIRKTPYSIKMDSDFPAVIRECGRGRADSGQTWITPQMESAYLEMYRLGHAHSVEIRDEEELVGGLYGIAIGKVFFGESMFSKQANASKLALVALARQLQAWQFGVIDCQVKSGHLLSLGAEEIARDSFVKLIGRYTKQDHPSGHWKFDTGFRLADAV